MRDISVIRYHRDDIETLVGELAAEIVDVPHVATIDWTLVIDCARRGGNDGVLLQIEHSHPGGNRIASCPLDGRRPGNTEVRSDLDPHTTLIARGRGDPSRRYSAVAAVRRRSFIDLFNQCNGADPEPVLNYLRCCGVIVLD